MISFLRSLLRRKSSAAVPWAASAHYPDLDEAMRSAGGVDDILAQPSGGQDIGGTRTSPEQTTGFFPAPNAVFSTPLRNRSRPVSVSCDSPAFRGSGCRGNRSSFEDTFDLGSCTALPFDISLTVSGIDVEPASSEGNLSWNSDSDGSEFDYSLLAADDDIVVAVGLVTLERADAIKDNHRGMPLVLGGNKNTAISDVHCWWKMRS